MEFNRRLCSKAQWRWGGSEKCDDMTACKSGLARLLLHRLYCAWPLPSERKATPFPLAAATANAQALLMQRVDLVWFWRCADGSKLTALSLRRISYQWICGNSVKELCGIVANTTEKFCSLLWHDCSTLLLRFADSSVLVGNSIKSNVKIPGFSSGGHNFGTAKPIWMK